MVALQKIDDSMFDDIYKGFLVDDDPDLGRDEWQRLFRCRPDSGHDYSGYALVDGSKIGGVLGMFFSTRLINGQERRFCNLHSWMVDSEYRGYSLMMMRPAMRLRDHTVNDFTPTVDVRKISHRLGFQKLDAALRILLPPGRFDYEDDDVELIQDEEGIRSRLTGQQLQLFNDHQMPHIGHLYCSTGTDHCYVIYSRVDRWRLPYCHIHYFSDPAQFEKHHVAIRREILRSEPAKFLAGNDRQMKSLRLPRSFRMPFANGQMFRSDGTCPEQIDSLYSDVAYLNLTTVNSVSAEIKERFGWS